MYDKILRQMRKAARAERIVIRKHTLNEMGIDDLSEGDIINGILTGEIIEDQFDIDYQDTKYIIYGDALDGREIGLVAKMDRYGNVAIITAYWLKFSDYE